MSLKSVTVTCSPNTQEIQPSFKGSANELQLAEVKSENNWTWSIGLQKRATCESSHWVWGAMETVSKTYTRSFLFKVFAKVRPFRGASRVTCILLPALESVRTVLHREGWGLGTTMSFHCCWVVNLSFSLVEICVGNVENKGRKRPPVTYREPSLSDW